MKSIFQRYNIIGFDFDNTIVHIDRLHMRSWQRTIDLFDLNIDTSSFFIHKVSKFSKFDNYSNIVNCLINNE